MLDDMDYPKPNPTYMNEEFLRRVFSDERVVTLEDIPWRDKSMPLPSALRKNMAL